MKYFNLKYAGSFLNIKTQVVFILFLFTIVHFSGSWSPPDQVPELRDLEVTPGVQRPAHLLGAGQAPDVGGSLVLGPGNHGVNIIIRKTCIIFIF